MICVKKRKVNIENILKRVKKDSCGAVLFFVGTVRNENYGKKVKGIEYECYRPMAENELRKIREELIKKYGLGECVIIHRIGRMKVGEISLVVAISSPHRKEGERALIEAVELIKKRVPVWKKEFFSDGSHAWVKGKILEGG